MSARKTQIDSFVADEDFEPELMEIIPPTAKQLGSLEVTHPEEYADGEYIGKWKGYTPGASDEDVAAAKLAGVAYNEVINMVKATDDLVDLETLETLETMGKGRQSVLKAIATRRLQLED
jgi:hypothetical protein